MHEWTSVPLIGHCNKIHNLARLSPTFVGHIFRRKRHRVVGRGGPWRGGRAQLVMALCRQNGGGGEGPATLQHQLLTTELWKPKHIRQSLVLPRNTCYEFIHHTTCCPCAHRRVAVPLAPVRVSSQSPLARLSPQSRLSAKFGLSSVTLLSLFQAST